MIPIVLTIWCITNGIWYVLAFVPLPFTTVAFRTFAKVYLGFLWTVAPEKLLIIPLAILIYRIIYREKFQKEEAQADEK